MRENGEHIGGETVYPGDQERLAQELDLLEGKCVAVNGSQIVAVGETIKEVLAIVEQNGIEYEDIRALPGTDGANFFLNQAA